MVCCQSARPPAAAAGMGDICSAWVTGRSGGPESTASLDQPDTSHTHQAGTSHPSSPLQQSLLQGTRREIAQRCGLALTCMRGRCVHACMCACAHACVHSCVHVTLLSLYELAQASTAFLPWVRCVCYPDVCCYSAALLSAAGVLSPCGPLLVHPPTPPHTPHTPGCLVRCTLAWCRRRSALLLRLS